MLFKFKKRLSSKQIGGDINYYNLNDWWLNELTEEERNIIRTIYKPMSTSPEEYCIDKGNIKYSSMSTLNFLGCLAGWFTKSKYYTIGKKILLEGEKYTNKTKDILDLHFFYLSGIRMHYSNRDNDDNALNSAIDYCKKQINISQEAKKEFLNQYPDSPLPSHTGYKQLAVIYDKQGQYLEALKITKQALIEGWNDDYQKRLTRLENKINKIRE